MLKTPICELLGIQHPIIQGGMAWVATAELASAVSNAGALGIIGAGNAPGEWVREQIRKTKDMTDRPFGVNVMLMSPFAKEVIDVVCEERVPVITTGAGNPGTLIPRFRNAGAKIIPVVASVALAKRMERTGVDALIAEGLESGGHIGEISTMALVPQVVDAVSIPVIAAGGFADGRGLVAALALGAKGVQMGTRFVCSTECIAHSNFKSRIVQAKDRSTITTGQTTGHPVRVIENRLARTFAEMERKGASVEDLEKLGIGKLRLGLIDGDMENGSLMAGQISGMICDIRPAQEIVNAIVEEAQAIIRNLAGFSREVSHV